MHAIDFEINSDSNEVRLAVVEEASQSRSQLSLKFNSLSQVDGFLRRAAVKLDMARRNGRSRHPLSCVNAVEVEELTPAQRALRAAQEIVADEAAKRLKALLNQLKRQDVDFALWSPRVASLHPAVPHAVILLYCVADEAHSAYEIMPRGRKGVGLNRDTAWEIVDQINVELDKLGCDSAFAWRFLGDEIGALHLRGYEVREAIRVLTEYLLESLWYDYLYTNY